MTPRVPVTVVTGFLGAGKTTLVRHLLGQEPAGRTLVIENELAALDVDGPSARAAGADVITLAGGCVCCGSRYALIGALASVAADPPSSRPQRVLIETTGAARPRPLLLDLVAGPPELGWLELDAVVAVADAVHVVRQLATTLEVAEQLAAADVVVLSKGDLLDAAARADAEGAVRALNPLADVAWASHGAVDPAVVLDRGGYRTELLEAPLPPAPAGGVAAHGGLRAAVVRVPGELDPDAAERLIVDLLDTRAPDVFRIKGVLAIRGEERRVGLHVVHELVDAAPLDAWGDRPRVSELALIARELPPLLFEEGLRGALAPAR